MLDVNGGRTGTVKFDVRRECCRSWMWGGDTVTEAEGGDDTFDAGFFPTCSRRRMLMEIISPVLGLFSIQFCYKFQVGSPMSNHGLILFFTHSAAI